MLSKCLTKSRQGDTRVTPYSLRCPWIHFQSGPEMPANKEGGPIDGN